jgi:hypothetical protein
MLPRRLDICRLGRRVDDEGPIRHWLHLDRLFEKTTKQNPPKLRAAAIEAKGKLVEIRLEMVRLDGPLMVSVISNLRALSAGVSALVHKIAASAPDGGVRLLR